LGGIDYGTADRRYSNKPIRGRKLHKTSLWDISSSSLEDGKLPATKQSQTYQLSPKQNEKFILTKQLKQVRCFA